MKATKEDMIWLLNDTVEYYSENTKRRCQGEAGGCFYNPASVGLEHISDGCAIGRWMTPVQKQSADAWLGGTVGVSELPPELMPEKLKKYSIKFLSAIQNLHDSNLNWDERGLTRYGEREVNDILNGIKIGRYDTHTSN